MRGLTEAEELELLALAEAEYGGESLTDFIARVAPHEPPPEHISAELIPELERALHEPSRLLVFMPPRHAKSVTVMRGLVWSIQRNPALLNAYVAYGAGQAEDQSRWMRQVARDAGIQLAQDTKAVDLWRTRYGGGLRAVGIDGGITGKGIKGWLVIDDPHKDRLEAESPVFRDRVWKQFQGTLYNRLEDTASVIVIQTRWHEEDLAGRILAGELGEKWKVIEMPAIRDPRTGEPAEDDETDGLALWPERFPVERLRIIRKTGGAYNWWSLYQQRPRPHGTHLFGRHPALYDLPEVSGARGVIICDPAATAKTSSDYTAIGVFSAVGVGVNCRMYVLEIVRMQAPMTQVMAELVRLQKHWGYPIGFEGVGGFKAVPDMMRTLHPGVDIFEITPLGDKVTRAQPCAAAWADDRVLVPRAEAPWIRPYLAEMRSFTGLGDTNDDQVDVTAHAWNQLYREAPPYEGQVVESAW